MKRYLASFFIGACAFTLISPGCDKISSALGGDEKKSYDVRYAVTAMGDTTDIIYRDQNGELQQEILVHSTLFEYWEKEFRATEGSQLWISSMTWGEDILGATLVSSNVFIFIDEGAAVAQDGTSADAGECSCFPFDLGCFCFASASFDL